MTKQFDHICHRQTGQRYEETVHSKTSNAENST